MTCVFARARLARSAPIRLDFSQFGALSKLLLKTTFN
jgi:hypothetical protein